jgi:hypothetical protein
MHQFIESSKIENEKYFLQKEEKMQVDLFDVIKFLQGI